MGAVVRIQRRGSPPRRRREAADPDVVQRDAAVASRIVHGGAAARAALRPVHLVTLQRMAGNRAVAAAIGPVAPVVPVVQRVATQLVAGLDADVPSTYDSGGGHSYADHGAHTTKEAHVTRVNTGVAPSGRVSRVPPGKGSSKFVSDDKHKEAFKQALADITVKNRPKQKVRGAGNVIGVSGAGTTYFGDGSSSAADKVQLDIQSIDDTTIRINSMYPVT